MRTFARLNEKAMKQHLASHDPVLQEIIPTMHLMVVRSTENVFHDLMSCVIEQQIHYRSTKKTFSKLLNKADIVLLTPHNFEVFEERALQQLKLSRPKYKTIAALLEFFQEPEPAWQAMQDAEVYERLSSISGIGKWTIEMILIYTLERPDVFPAQDFHLRKVMTQLYAIDEKRQVQSMKEVAAHWSPYQSYAVRYLLAWKAAQKRQPH